MTGEYFYMASTNAVPSRNDRHSRDLLHNEGVPQLGIGTVLWMKEAARKERIQRQHQDILTPAHLHASLSEVQSDVMSGE